MKYYMGHGYYIYNEVFLMNKEVTTKAGFVHKQYTV